MDNPGNLATQVTQDRKTKQKRKYDMSPPTNNWMFDLRLFIFIKFT